MMSGSGRLVLLLAACMAGMGLFLAVSFIVGGQLGFPLDDAWIHQTYARNLARHGRLEFVPGMASAGSTAPLWTGLLAVGYLLGLPYRLWAYLLGGLSLFWLAWATMGVWRILWPSLAGRDWLAGLTVVWSWPLLWAAASGMETGLFAALGMQAVWLYLRLAQGPAGHDRRPALAGLGLLCGLLVLARPEGVLLVLLVGGGLLLRTGSVSRRLERGLIFGVTAVLPLLPYFLFNYWTNGTPWPNTSDAKQTEYAFLLAEPFLSRWGRLLFFSLGGPASGWRGLSGAHLLLLPGVLLAGWRGLQADWAGRRLYAMLPLLWAGGHIGLYAWRLPVTYQHGRYLMVILPVWVSFGLAGWLLLLAGERGRGRWFGRQVARFTFALLLLFFLVQGAAAYATDVAIIEGEMVAVAHWLAENTPAEAVIATHDIGAIGYFAERPLLDLAGLITPEIIPLLDDESALAQYVVRSRADYLVTAPGWGYEAITQSGRSRLLFSTNFALTQAQGVNNMAVYELVRP